jgi:hypothetical protein
LAGLKDVEAIERLVVLAGDGPVRMPIRVDKRCARETERRPPHQVLDLTQRDIALGLGLDILQNSVEPAERE